MPKSRERQLGGACSAADRLSRFDDADGASSLGERDRSSKAVGPRPDDDSVKRL